MKEFDKLKKRLKHSGKSKNPFIKMGMNDLHLLITEIDHIVILKEKEISVLHKEIAELQEMLSKPAVTPISVKLDGGDF